MNNIENGPARDITARERCLPIGDVEALEKTLCDVQGKIDIISGNLISRALYEDDVDVRNGLMEDLHALESQLAKMQGMVRIVRGIDTETCYPCAELHPARTRY